VLERHKESRRRNLSFHLPLIIPFAPQVRIVQDDPSYCSLQDIYEDHCDNIKLSKDEPIIYFINKMKSNISNTTTVRNLNIIDLFIKFLYTNLFINSEKRCHQSQN
jgi:transformation/transcription domain-associated protein